MHDRIKPETFESLRKGDPKAFESIFLLYHNKIITFIRAIIKSDDVEDITQDIFAKLWTNRQKIDPQKSLNAYMYTAARNAAFNYLKHKTVGNTYLANHTLKDVDISPEDILYAREIELLTEMVVSQMPTQREKMYRMSRNDGMTNEEIANQLGVTKKTVENQLSLALKELRKVIAAFTLFFV